MTRTRISCPVARVLRSAILAHPTLAAVAFETVATPREHMAEARLREYMQAWAALAAGEDDDSEPAYFVRALLTEAMASADWTQLLSALREDAQRR